jgi:hypothetical protein
MVYPDTFQGFQIEDPKFFTDFKLNEMQPKPFGDYDVDIKILACGVCASDVHTLSGGWGEQHFPLCCGHGMFLSFFFTLLCISVAILVSQREMKEANAEDHRNRWYSAEGRAKGYTHQAR